MDYAAEDIFVGLSKFTLWTPLVLFPVDIGHTLVCWSTLGPNLWLITQIHIDPATT